MELINPKHIIFSILFFLGGCLSYGPPQPVEITTPRSVTTEKLSEFPSVLIDIPAKTVTAKFINRLGNGSEIKIEPISDTTIGYALDEILKKTGNTDAFVFMIRTGHRKEEKFFTSIVEALRKRGIFKFKLVTTPE